MTKSPKINRPSFSPIAIVGRSCVLPGALSPAALWKAVDSGKDLISDAPDGRWGTHDEDILCSPDDNSSDRTWSKRGGYVRDFSGRWDPSGFAMDAAELRGLDPLFLWTLHCAREALKDIEGNVNATASRPRVSAVFGNLGFPAAGMTDYAESVWLDSDDTPDPRNRFMSGGAASLLQQALNLGPHVLCLDTACASSLYAIAIACEQLTDHKADLALAGGVNASDDLFIHMGFTALNAMSPTGRSRPFHSGADGLVPAEGAAFVALKRLEDARADGDRIHGVIRGIGLSNDGRGRGFLAPAKEGQQRAIDTAYNVAGLRPSDISLIECHATGTSVGDATELQSTSAAYAGCSAVPLGSLKSNMGHLITAAGAAGLIKVLEAIHHQRRPQTLHCEAPNEALNGGPFRLLTEAEDWPSDGPRIAAVSAFGFGGNNAHLIVSEEDPSIAAPAGASRSTSAPSSVPLAIVAAGTLVGAATNRQEFTQTLLRGDSLLRPGPSGLPEARMADIPVGLRGLRFPPKDLEQALPQQVALLAAAREAVTQCGPLDSIRTGVFVGMEPDPAVCRYGLRWRQAQRLWEGGTSPAGHPEWLARTKDEIIPVLTSAGVVGTMPNVPANRLNSQLDLGGASYSVSAGEDSGLRALELAARALRTGTLDAALVGATDLSCEPVHVRAMTAMEGRPTAPGDAAVALVIKRLEDALRDGEEVLAVLEETPSGSTEATAPSLDDRLGRSWAAGDLRDLAAGALCLSHRAHRDGRPWLDASEGEPGLVVGRQVRFSLRPHSAPAPAIATPRIHPFGAATASALTAAIEAGDEGGDGPCRAVLVAHNAKQLAMRKQQAVLQIVSDAPETPGVYVQLNPLEGDLAFVFSGAGAAYSGMGRELLQALPELHEQLSSQSEEATKALSTPWAGDTTTPPLQRLWASSALSQIHAALSQGLLGLKADAVIGYSSGESNSLFASGIWTDLDAMIRAGDADGLFSQELGGAFAVAESAWGRPADWQTWTVLAQIDEVAAEVNKHEHLYLAVLHSEHDCIIAGAGDACEAAVAALGAGRCLRLHYDLSVHVPLVDTVREAWLALHRRAVSDGPHPRVYSAGLGASYVPSSETCAEAIFAQANDTLDFTRVIEAAWADGVRIFVEHGPQGSCSRWIRDILGDREAVIVPLDRKGKGLDPIYEAIAALLAAGVTFDPSTLLQRLDASVGAPSPTLTFPAHRAPLRGIPLPPSDTDSPSHPAQSGRQIMRPAPPLRPVLAEDLPPAQLPPIARPHRPADSVPAAGASPLAPVRATVATESYSAVEASIPTASYGGGPSKVSDPRITALRAHLTAVSQSEQQHIAQQAALHQQFLQIQEQAMQLLLRGPAGIPSVVVPLPAAAAPLPTAPPSALPTVTPALSSSRPTPLVGIVPPVPVPVPENIEQKITETHVPPTPTGPTFDFAQLNVHSSGKISEIFGPDFAGQDDYHRQVRMPEPPLLLADRITGLDAVAGSMGKGIIWSESDVLTDRWFMHQGHMPAGIMIESGQADLMLISYLGVDQSNRGERVYRLLGCELTYYGGLPKAGELLQYDIHMDGHATQGDVRLMFFHSDCRSDGELRLSVRKGQAGFFTDEELADSDGCLWTPEGQELASSPRLDPPFVACTKSDFSIADIRAFADGRPWDCFGEALVGTMPHTRTPRIQNGPMLLLGDVTNFSTTGGPWGRGYAKSTVEIDPKTWFFDGHFKNDPCMPGTLMFEGCLQLMGFFLAGLGYTAERDGWRFEPVSGEPFQLSCRGQVTPSSKVLTYELFVEEVHDGPIPTLYADLLCTIDGLKAFHARRVALQITPSWPLDEGSSLLEGYIEPKPVAMAGDFPFDYRSLVACAQGRPSEAFGPIYDRFDAPGRVARLPNPPYHFLSRVTRTAGLIGSMDDGLEVDVEYDIPEDAWYFDENGCRAMPFAVLLEAALQPCGWLASYMGCALTTAEELCFRNLDGEGRLLVDLLPDSGTLLTKVRSTRTSQMGTMIIVAFEVECSIGGTPVYELDTVFGFFPQEALENQVGLPVSDIQRASLDAASDLCIDLTQRPAGCWEPDRPTLAEPMLLMLDRITGFDPTGGEAGLGTARGEKDVNPGEWFFKAHFFQDPVQPGSLGIEAMIQLLQWTMLEMKLDAGIADPRFETLALNETMSWKYRGQVVPKNSVISSTLEITEVRQESGSVLAIAEASLWVDGKRIYEASNLGMRIVSGGTPGPRITTLAPDTDPWLLDHCPTWTVPALPMMSMVDLLAQGACTADPVTALRDVRVAGWFVMDSQRVLHTERAGDKVRLLCTEEDGGTTEVASAIVLTGAYGARPLPLPVLDGAQSPLPYESGELFHGPSFQVMESLVQTSAGASSILRAATGVPSGRLNPGLLDGATHGIPHAELGRWDPTHPEGMVAYPAFITEMHFYGATPKSGTVRCEVRPDGHLGSRDFPAFAVQLIGDEGVWCTYRLIESCFPKGPIGDAAPLARRAFLRDRQEADGLGLSRSKGGVTELSSAQVEGMDWLPGTVQSLFGTTDAETIARHEHIGRAHSLHPSVVPGGLPLHSFDLITTREEDGTVRVEGDGRGQRDLSRVRDFWSNWFDRGPWPVEDLYYGLIERFLGRVVLTDPGAFATVRGRSVLYLANHQVGVESLLFSILASALGEVPTVTLAKAEHRTTWLGQLIAHCFDYPGVEDPRVISFFDRSDKASLPAILKELAAEMAGPGRSVMVHIEGTRSLDCRTPVAKMSGAFLDMAIATGAPIVPVRFVGGLPTTPLDARIEFPLGLGRQDIYFGTPIEPKELEQLHYGARKDLVLDAINALGPDHSEETPLPSDPEFAAKVDAWQQTHGVSHEHAVLREVLAEMPGPGEEVARLLAATEATELNSGLSGAWLEELGQRLLGTGDGNE